MVAPVDCVTSYTHQTYVCQVFLKLVTYSHKMKLLTKFSKDRRTNLRDVALAANVSVATVSRVLNFPEKVSPNTRARVEKIIEKLDLFQALRLLQLIQGVQKFLAP